MANLTLKGLTAVLVASTCVVSAPALASPKPWVHPGQHPFQGTPYEAAVLHEKVTGLPNTEYMKGVALFQTGQCEDYFMQDGEPLHNTFTKDGKARSVQTVVAFKDPKTGRSLAADDPKRRAARCRIPGREDGATVVYPYVCDNWSFQYLPVTRRVRILYRLEQQIDYSMPKAVKSTITTPGQFSPGVFIQGCPADCVCVSDDVYAPPTLTPGNTIEVFSHQ